MPRAARSSAAVAPPTSPLHLPYISPISPLHLSGLHAEGGEELGRGVLAASEQREALQLPLDARADARDQQPLEVEVVAVGSGLRFGLGFG